MYTTTISSQRRDCMNPIENEFVFSNIQLEQTKNNNKK